jgi:HlyD family secretion protein
MAAPSTSITMQKKYIKAALFITLVLVIIYCIIHFTTSVLASDELELHGNVDIRQVELGFRVSGRITEMRFEEGDTVKAGDILAVLDKAPYEYAVELARADAASANANLAKMEAGNRPQEIEQARANLEQQQAAFENANILYQRQQKLIQTGAISKQAYDDALAQKKETEAALLNAQEALALSLAGFRQEDIAAAHASLQATDAQYETSLVNLADTDIIAPNDGFILTRILEPGAIVAAGTPVYTLSLVKPVWARVYVSEPDLGKIKPGMKVKVFSDTFPDQPLDGQIGYVSPQAEFTPKNVETQELRSSLVYRVRVTVTDPTEKLRQGMPITVKVPLK